MNVLLSWYAPEIEATNDGDIPNTTEVLL